MLLETLMKRLQIEENAEQLNIAMGGPVSYNTIAAERRMPYGTKKAAGTSCCLCQEATQISQFQILK